jgi:hypothetical protein
MLPVFAAVAAASGGATASGVAGPCVGSQLRADVEVQGATGHLMGVARFFDRGPTCTLRGRPLVTLESPAGRALPVSRGNVGPLWRLNHEHAPRGWPVVTLGHARVAATFIQLGNWCGQHDARITLVFHLRKPRGVVRGSVRMGVGCMAPRSPVGVSIGPFEPAPRS